MIIRRDVLALLPACGLLGTGTSLNAAPRGRSLEFGIYSDTIFNLPVLIALEQGFFRDVGVTLTLRPDLSVKETEAHLASGRFPFEVMAPDVAWLHRQAGSDDVRILSGIANRPPHFLIAQPRFKKVTDLRGANLGVISATEGTTHLFRRIMSAEGIPPGQYKITVAGSAPQRVAKLDRGEIDAALQPMPLSYEAEAKGFSNLGWVGNWQPDWQFGVLMANRKWLEQDPQCAEDCMTAVLRGRRFMRQDPEISARIAAKHLRTSLDNARRSLADLVRLDIVQADLQPSGSGTEAIYRTHQEIGLVPKDAPFRMSDYSDPRFLRKAIQRLA